MHKKGPLRQRDVKALRLDCHISNTKAFLHGPQKGSIRTLEKFQTPELYRHVMDSKPEEHTYYCQSLLLCRVVLHILALVKTPVSCKGRQHWKGKVVSIFWGRIFNIKSWCIVNFNLYKKRSKVWNNSDCILFIFLMFLKEVSYAQQNCMYFILCIIYICLFD